MTEVVVRQNERNKRPTRRQIRRAVARAERQQAREAWEGRESAFRRWAKHVTWDNFRQHAWHNHLGLLNYRAWTECGAALTIYRGWHITELQLEIDALVYGELPDSDDESSAGDSDLDEQSDVGDDESETHHLAGGTGSGGIKNYGSSPDLVHGGVLPRGASRAAGLRLETAGSGTRPALRALEGDDGEGRRVLWRKARAGKPRVLRSDVYERIYARGQIFLFATRIDVSLALAASVLMHLLVFALAWYFRYIEHPNFGRPPSRLVPDTAAHERVAVTRTADYSVANLANWELFFQLETLYFPDW